MREELDALNQKSQINSYQEDLSLLHDKNNSLQELNDTLQYELKNRDMEIHNARFELDRMREQCG
jgi:hypothetical protein